MWHLNVRSRNKSCAPLRLIEVPCRVVYRMGSSTKLEDCYKRKIPHNAKVIEINSPEACTISGNKILMKKRFIKGRIHTANWFVVKEGDYDFERIQHYLGKWEKIIAKHKFSSKGNGIYLLTSMDDVRNKFIPAIREHGQKISDFVFERYYSYTREYRIHVTRKGCFYASRKVLIADAQDRWHRHANNTTFINEENPLFNKPDNWDSIVTNCVDALKALQLDIAAFDVKVAKDGRFIILESNSAPALGERGIERYTQVLKEMINERL